MTRLVFLLTLAALAACSQQPAGDALAPASETRAASPAAAAPEPPARAVPRRTHRYTALTGCKLVREEHEEMPFSEVLCAGPGGWALRIADSDARQTMAVVAHSGEETSLDLSPISAGAFNSFGPTAEWRGAAREPFTPDSLIVRFRVAEQPHPAPETTYLLAVRLSPRPCVLSKVAPGPVQNDSARASADDPGACIAN